jgi:hypothetical protein
MKMQAIQTKYKGYFFRSRLEARWAVFFDALGYKWEYEPEGYRLSGGQLYLPDFRITSPQGMIQWYEVKPGGTVFDEKFFHFKKEIQEEEKRNGFNGATGYVHACMLSGDPLACIEEFRSDGNGGICPRCGAIGSFDSGLSDGDDNVSIGCWYCDCSTPCGGGHETAHDSMFMPYRPHKGWVIVDRHDYRAFELRVTEAAEKARSARFEHDQREKMARFR